MTCSWLVLTLLGQSATITYEPNPPAEAEQVEAQEEQSAQTQEAWDTDAAATSTETESSGALEKSVAAASPRMLDSSARGRTLFRGAVEVTAFSLPSGGPGGGQDLFVSAMPILAVDTGDAFAFELGAPLRLRTFDSPPAQRDQDFGGLLRRADWDQLSDFGQILRDLRLFSGDSPLVLRAGPLFLRTLGRGHLVDRYSNQINPDYHPAGARADLFMGPFRVELLASDIFALRLFAADFSMDIAQAFGLAPDLAGRYHASVSAAHDFGLAGGPSPSLSLLQVDGDLALYHGEAAQVFAYTGLGTRMLTPDFAMGALLGVSVDALFPDGGQFGFKLEGRKTGGGFRFGMFGPAYELSRFSDRGLGFTGTSDVRLPDGLSAYAQMQIGAGAFDATALSRDSAILFSTSAEWFTFGRLDADGAFTARLPGGTGALTARFTGVDLLATPRYQGSGELRFRFAPSFYFVAEGGLVFFPQPDGTLLRGFFASAGVGADFSR